MTKRRRVFDIDLPDEETGPAVTTPAPAPDTGALRRGPMAAAIEETSQSLRDRAAVEDEIRAENDALAHEFVRLKNLGLITDLISLNKIRATKLTRDRMQDGDHEIEGLKESIRAIGLSNPIRVEPTDDGGYELVQGWRRLKAFRELRDETGEERFAHIPAGLLPRGETLDSLYRRMVDENLVRKDISWAEMATLAQNYAEDENTSAPDVDTAVNQLYASASPQKRSYIRRFALLLSSLGTSLRFPEAIPRALGLELAGLLEGEFDKCVQLSSELLSRPERDAEKEVAILREYLAVQRQSGASTSSSSPRGRPARRGKTTLRMELPMGAVKCVAQSGKVELQLDQDFSEIDRARLEAAVEAFFTALD